MRAALVAAALLAGCTALPGAHPVEGPVRLGQVAAVNGPRVRPEQVIEDSRCPVDVTCVWAGRLVLRTTVTGGGWSKRLDLVLGEPVQVADGTLTLASVTPDRRFKHAPKPADLRFTFAFQGGL